MIFLRFFTINTAVETHPKSHKSKGSRSHDVLNGGLMGFMRKKKQSTPPFKNIYFFYIKQKSKFLEIVTEFCPDE